MKQYNSPHLFGNRNPQNSAPTEILWDNFCLLRLESRAYRTIEDPIVAVAYSDWLAGYLADCEAPKTTNVFPFRKTAARA